MDKVEELIKEYLKSNRDLSQGRTRDCLDEQVLLEYLQGDLNEERQQAVEYHLAACGFCLSQLNIASQAMSKQKNFEPVPQKLIEKTKAALGISQDKGNKKRKKRLYFLGAVVFFILSFVIPRYFIQFLVATLILGIRWAFESEGGRTLIMVLDSWRRHSQDKDDEISRYLKNRL